MKDPTSHATDPDEPESSDVHDKEFRSSARSSAEVPLALWLLGKRIRTLREKLALTQLAAAVRAEIDPKHWQVIEQGGTNPTVASLVAISRALRVSVKDLF